jgi:transposase
MSLATAPLPKNLDELLVFAASLQTEVQVFKDELYTKTLYIEKLKLQLAALRRARFGRSSEKLDREIGQLEMQLGDLEEGQAEHAERQKRAQPQSSPAAPRKRTQPVRKPLPEHLPRERVEHDAACICPRCGGERLRRIGTDEREVLEYVPSHFKVIVHSRPKMSCRDCEKITQEPMPPLPIERGIPGPGLLAHILIAKYDDHLPLYRQNEIYKRDGVDLDRSTLAEWVGQTAFLLTSLADAIGTHVRAGESIHADDTHVPVLAPGNGATKTGRLWIALRDERPWGSTVPPAVFYRYSPDRKGEQARILLGACTGYLHADAYSGFGQLYEPNITTEKPRLLEVGCWAHARRKVYEVHKSDPSPAAQGLLEQIGELFVIENAIHGKSQAERHKIRTEQAVPLLYALKEMYESVLDKISAKSNLAGALRYALNRWPSMTRYTTDGRLEICNNAAERAIRPIAIGRKNWMFAGSDTGGQRAATIYTIFETAKLCSLEPEAYLRDIIGRIGDHPINRIDELLPWNWSLELKTSENAREHGTSIP